MNIINFLSKLPGNWSLNRTIYEFPRKNIMANCKGSASFKPDKKNKNHLAYEEKGDIELPEGKSTSFYKSYHYLIDDEDFKVYFDPELKNLFHKVLTSDLIGKHFCDPDTYQTHYQFTSENAFKTICKVSGPNKNYEIHTMFIRIVSNSK